MEIKKTFILSDLSACVNKRELTFDFRMHEVIYTYCGINKTKYNLTFKRAEKTLKKYKIREITKEQFREIKYE